MNTKRVRYSSVCCCFCFLYKKKLYFVFHFSSSVSLSSCPRFGISVTLDWQIQQTFCCCSFFYFLFFLLDCGCKRVVFLFHVFSMSYLRISLDKFIHYIVQRIMACKIFIEYFVLCHWPMNQPEIGNETLKRSYDTILLTCSSHIYTHTQSGPFEQLLNLCVFVRRILHYHDF